MNDATFDGLRDDGSHRATPDAGFVRSLRRRIEQALDEPTLHLADRKDTTMATETIASDTTTSDTTTSDTSATPTRQILTPYLSVHDGAGALDWYSTAMGAEETVRYVGDDGRLGHAEFIVAGARVMLSDAYPEIGVVAANSYEGSSCALHLDVDDCDGLHDRAVAAGATSMSAPADQPHGARNATIMDPYGHRWMLSQQLTNPTTADIDAAYDDYTVIENTTEHTTENG